jgi:hypothetical protein
MANKTIPKDIPDDIKEEFMDAITVVLGSEDKTENSDVEVLVSLDKEKLSEDAKNYLLEK